MSRSITSLFALYILTPGRRIYALGRVRERAKAKDLGELVAAIEAAIAHDRHTLELDAARFERAKIPVRERDAEVDRTLGTIDHLLAYYAQTKNLTASALLVTLFPNGLAHHIRLPQIEQAAANERVLSILEGDTHKSWLDVHGLRPLIEQLRAEHDAFAAALHARDAESVPTWDEVKQARERGQELYLHIVAQIVAQFTGKPDVLDDLLEPIWTQDQLIQDYRRQRRNVADVDPDSGEVLAQNGDEPGDEGGGQGGGEASNA